MRPDVQEEKDWANKHKMEEKRDNKWQWTKNEWKRFMCLVHDEIEVLGVWNGPSENRVLLF